MRISGKLDDLRFEIDVLIGDMEGEDSAGREVALVEIDGLGREQVDWDGIARERIDNEDIEVLRQFLRQRGSCIAFHNADLRTRFAKIGEDILRNRRNSRIDLIKADVIAGLAVCGDSADAQANGANVTRAPLTTVTECEADTRILSVVRGWGLA